MYYNLMVKEYQALADKAKRLGGTTFQLKVVTFLIQYVPSLYQCSGNQQRSHLQHGCNKALYMFQLH